MAKRGGQQWLEGVLLGLLLTHERCGPELPDPIREVWRTQGGGEGEMAEGMIYPTLRRLERRGLLVGKWMDVGEGRPKRRYYAMTPKGQRAAEARRVARPKAVRAMRGARP